MVRNPAIKEWNSEYKYLLELKEWKEKFDRKASKIEAERMESYQNDMKQRQEDERYAKSKTGGSAMQHVMQNLKKEERDLLDKFAAGIQQKFTKQKVPVGRQKLSSFRAHSITKSACETAEQIKHFRKADSIFLFDPTKHMSMSKKEKANLNLYNQYIQMNFLIENKTLSEGETFGELAIINKMPRAATVTCLTDCYFAVMNANDYNQFVVRIYNKKIANFCEFIRQLPYFSHWTLTQVRKLVKQF
jgi:hypothetical protein